MDLDQLISLTVAESPATLQRAPDTDISVLVNQLMSRLESSPALETQLHSLNELSLLATTSPGPLLVCLPSVCKLLSSSTMSPTILLALFSFLCALFASSARDQAKDAQHRTTAKVNFLKESINGLSLAFAYSTQTQNATTSPALSVLVWLLSDADSMDLVTKILQRKTQTPSFSTETCLAEHLVQLLRVASPDAFTVVDLILSIPEAMDGQSTLVASCIKTGILEQALKNIEADKVTTPRAISSMHILTKSVSLAANLSLSDATFSLSQEVIQRNIIGGLGDLVHACTYSLINDLANKKPFGDAVATVLSKSLNLIKTLISSETKQVILDSKIFSYSLMLVCSPADADFMHKDIRLVSLDAISLIVQLVEADQVSHQKMANTVLLCLQPGVPMRSTDVLTRLSHILTVLGGKVDLEFYDTVLHLLLGTYQYKDLVSGCLNAMTNPLFSLYKASWTDGFKLLARTLGMKAPEGMLKKSSNEQLYARFAAYVQEAQKDYRAAIVQTLGKGDPGPKCSISKQSCLNLMQCIANSESSPTVLAASAACLLSMITNDNRNGQCLALSALSCPKTIYDIVPTFLGALFGSTARILLNQQSVVNLLVLLIALLDILKNESFFAVISLFYIGSPAELVKHLITFITISLKTDIPILIRAMTAFIIASMPASFYATVSPLLSETFNNGESLRAVLEAALVQGKAVQLPESPILLPHLARFKNNIDATIGALNALPFVQKTPTTTSVLPVTHSLEEQDQKGLPHSSVPLPQLSVVSVTNSTQTDLDVDALIAAQTLLRQELIQLREENARLTQELSAQVQKPALGTQHVHVSTNLAPIFESQTFESTPVDIAGENTGEITMPTITRSEHLTSETEESDHVEEKLESEIPNVGVSDCLQPLTDATATSNPEDFFDQIESQASLTISAPFDQNPELLTSNISLANADLAASTQPCSDLHVTPSQGLSDPVSLPLPDDSLTAREAPIVNEQPPILMVPINMPIPSSNTVGSRRPGRGGIRARYATGLSEDARKNIATAEQNS
ncbi:Hypothetical protein GLP15_1048 [Giardia lamblia P15]|uniref:Uncharacterized protein n=1 Tax=Giardia intestinalis (strain P15) TaxID=658858 RepID=E1F2Y7_GIAIA|nr:Hypothetical protein GLP15_1048 [Giardia lamblia P15]